MPQVTIARHEEQESDMGGAYRCWRFWGHYENQDTGLTGDFVVDCEDDQYDYLDGYNLPGIEDEPDGDEPIQIAIGNYMEQHNIDPGIAHR